MLQGFVHIDRTLLAPEAVFEEWPLDDATLKCAMVSGVATFQLEFTWGPCADRQHNAHTVRGTPPSKLVPGRPSTKRQTGARLAWTPEEDNLLIELKKQGLA